MSAIIIAFLLLGAVPLAWQLVTITRNHQKRRKMRQLLKQFSELGTKYGLSFSSQEVLYRCIIGLDGINRKLLVLTLNEKIAFQDFVIDLDELKNCYAKKYYGKICAGALKRRPLKSFLERITLHFEFNNGKQPLEMPFYNHFDENVFQVKKVEKKADRWKQILTKMLKPSPGEKH